MRFPHCPHVFSLFSTRRQVARPRLGQPWEDSARSRGTGPPAWPVPKTVPHGLRKNTGMNKMTTGRGSLFPYYEHVLGLQDPHCRVGGGNQHTADRRGMAECSPRVTSVLRYRCHLPSARLQKTTGFSADRQKTPLSREGQTQGKQQLTLPATSMTCDGRRCCIQQGDATWRHKILLPVLEQHRTENMHYIGVVKWQELSKLSSCAKRLSQECARSVWVSLERR